MNIHSHRVDRKIVNYITGTQEFFTSLIKADAEVPRSAGSMDKRVSIKSIAGVGKSLNVSETHRL